ncbi:Hypothetical_protein [Hexamita inflata]|uniref:Hypothetical_protein n=1 Tax=Hexamita inflata TaxID=28002 RepID=A0AA86NV58_9EUKA|nr:Hypothetical protein HINF_LOCUS13372 [Hexamita inflata]
MIFATVICSVRWIKWSPQEALQSFQQSKDDVLDLVECNSNVYQVMKDGTVQMRGMKYGLLNKESFEFVKLDISFPECFAFQDRRLVILHNQDSVWLKTALIQGKSNSQPY